MNVASPRYPTTNPHGTPYACEEVVGAHCDGLGLEHFPIRDKEEDWWADLLCKFCFHLDNDVQSLNGLDFAVERRTVINDLFVFTVPNLTWVTVTFQGHCVIVALLPTPTSNRRGEEGFALTTRVFVSSRTAFVALRMIGDAVPWPSA